MSIECMPLDKSKLNVLDTLTCNHCERALNIPPIMSFRNSTTICGRCYDPKKYENVPPNEKPSRNIPLESVIQLFPFACVYREAGCQARNVTENYLKHEAVCRFGPFICPTDGCTWSGTMKDITTHFETNHPDNYSVTPVITVNTNIESTEYFLIKHENRQMLFQCKYDASKNIFLCDCVLLLNSFNCDEQTFQLHFNNGDFLSALFKQKICKALEPLDENKSLKIDIQALKVFLNTNDNLKAEIKILSNMSEEPNKINSNLLNEIKCPVCFLLFVPPVFLCSNGHSICDTCKNRMTSCPVCRVPYENAVHNYVLEQLIGEIVYPCKYYTLGCAFTSRSTEIRQHESGCEYSSIAF